MKRNKKRCNKCHVEISLSNYSKHLDKCNGIIKDKIDISLYKNDDETYQCNYCFKTFTKKGIAIHIWRSHSEEGKKFIPNKNVAWNKGLSKTKDERVKNASEKLSLTCKNKKINGMLHGCFSNDYYSSEQHKLNSAKGGGYKKNSGRGKKGFYKKYWCDSSWELAFVIYNLEHDIKFQRNKHKFQYEFEGKKLNYLPDFIMEDGTYIEIKNFNTKQTLAKYNQFPYTLKVICGMNEIKPYLDYVINKYGVDFIKLYED